MILVDLQKASNTLQYEFLLKKMKYFPLWTTIEKDLSLIP